ncbi:Dyp-type peroxidase [Arthrobacter bambusae]|nr:Dyp-type peroxidase [Arthrobacter bambusae]MDQ0129402.1 Dyp-type peroxidase family [Arthrobacter bambusae]MDQ0180985.1 Dyp-type peroxidase family [Arthrobacter bambusae]
MTAPRKPGESPGTPPLGGVLKGLFRRFVPPTLELHDIQALILRPRPAPYYGTHAFVEIMDAAGGREAMRRLRTRVTSAADWREARSAWTAVALSYRGLEALGAPASALASFPRAFREGMAARADKLRDHGPNDPSRWQAPFGTGRVHLMVSVYADSEEAWRDELAGYEEQFATLTGLRVLLRQDFGAQPESRNAFGFKDGFTQPVVEGSGVEGWPGDGRPIKAGEFILGYKAEGGHALGAPTPEVLGRNGTYLVFRKYHSHVDAFNRYLHQGADTPEGREFLAAKLVGRWRSGAPLELAPEHDDVGLGADDSRNNDFRYRDDPKGLRTPVGSHIRRMNPRDTELKVLSDVNIRRIIRRSTTYGEPLGDSLRDDGKPRGLDFIAISARAIDTVEFLQSEWINSGNFIGRGTEKDPLLGVQDENAFFTVPGTPPRRISGIETFNTLDGGEYFFMPSLTALDWLAGL